MTSKHKDWEPSEKWLRDKKAKMASKMGHELKGYEQRLKTDQDRKKYNREDSLAYRKRTGYYRTKIDSMGHHQGFLWAKKKKIDPLDRHRKYGLNSPSFDEGVHEYKMRLKSKLK
jgi:hypothetical protein